MTVSDSYTKVLGCVVRAEAIIARREREDPSLWAMTAFSRYRVAELLGVEPSADAHEELGGDPVALLEEAARSADQLVVPSEQLRWRSLLVRALRCALTDVRMVCGARDV